MISKFKLWVSAHKFVSGVIVLIVVIGGWYWYKAATATGTVTKYVVEKATTGTIIASVSGTGQMQAATTVDVKPQTSENVTGVYVTVGQHVVTGQLLVQLDTTNESQAVTEAKISLQNAQISLAKLQEAAATTTLEQDQDSISQSEAASTQASSTLVQDYQSGFDSLSASFVDFQNLITALQNFDQGKDISKSQNDPDAFVSLMPNYLQASALPYRNAVQSTFNAASTAYTQNLLDYNATNRDASPATLSSLFAETLATAKSISDATNAVKGFLNYVVDSYPASSSTNPLPPITNTLQTNFGNYDNTVNGDITNITNAINTVNSDETAIQNDALQLEEQQNALTELQAGPDPLDVQSQNLSIEQSQLNLQTAENNLADDSIRAPISGIVSAVDAVVGESVASPAVSIVGDQDVAEVTLNEIDAAKVSVGQTATLSFDALPNLSLAGKVVEIDAVGTVSQGVVNYNAQISLIGDSSSTEQVKPGMSVSATIVTQADQNVITLPNAAIKTAGTASYVLEPATALSDADVTTSQAGGIELTQGTKMVPVTVGISNDTETEVDSGVNVGDQVITQTVQSTASTASAAPAGGTSALRLLGGAGGGAGAGAAGGGGFRAGGGGGAGAGAR